MSQVYSIDELQNILIGISQNRTKENLTPTQAEWLLSNISELQGKVYTLTNSEEGLSKELKRFQTHLFGILEIVPGYNEDNLLDNEVGNAKSCIHNLHEMYKCRREFCKKIKKLLPQVQDRALVGEVDDDKLIEWIEAQISEERQSGIYEVKVSKKESKSILAEYFEKENVFHIFGSQEDFPSSHFEWISPLPINYTKD